MPALQPVVASLIGLLAMGPTMQEVQSEALTKSTACSVDDQTVLFRDARTEIKNVDRTFDVMVTPAGKSYGTSAALSAGTLKLDDKEHDWFELNRGWLVVRINELSDKSVKVPVSEPSDWVLVRIRMLDAGAEGTQFGVATGVNADGHEYVDIMLLEGGPVWVAVRSAEITGTTAPSASERKAEIDSDKAATTFIRATFPNDKADAIPSIQTLSYTTHSGAQLHRMLLIERAKVWSAANPPE